MSFDNQERSKSFSLSLNRKQDKTKKAAMIITDNSKKDLYNTQTLDHIQTNTIQSPKKDNFQQTSMLKDHYNTNEYGDDLDSIPDDQSTDAIQEIKTPSKSLVQDSKHLEKSQIQKQKAKLKEFEVVIKQMKERPCKDNIRKYKNELRMLRASQGQTSCNISHSQISKQRNELAQRLKANSLMAFKHRLLNTYLQQYKEKLSLPDPDQNQVTIQNKCGITVDYNELMQLKQATEETGFDPYAQYKEIQKDQQHNRRINRKSVINCWKDDRNEMNQDEKQITQRTQEIDEEIQLKQLLLMNKQAKELDKDEFWMTSTVSPSKRSPRPQSQMVKKKISNNKRESFDMFQSVYFQNDNQNGSRPETTKSQGVRTRSNKVKTLESLRDVWVNARNLTNDQKRMSKKYTVEISKCQRNFNKIEDMVCDVSKTIKKEQLGIQRERQRIVNKAIIDEMLKQEQEIRNLKRKQRQSILY